MSTRATLALLAVLVGCAAVAFFVQGPGSADRARERGRAVPGPQGRGRRADPRRAGPGAEVVLTREGGAWKLGAAKEPADGAAVEALLAKLAGVREGAVVSTNPAKQSVYEADAGQGIAVRLEGAGGKALAAFVVGKRGPDFASCYLRRDGASEVLLVSPDLRAGLLAPRRILARAAEDSPTAPCAGADWPLTEPAK